MKLPPTATFNQKTTAVIIQKNLCSTNTSQHALIETLGQSPDGAKRATEPARGFYCIPCSEDNKQSVAVCFAPLELDTYVNLVIKITKGLNCYVIIKWAASSKFGTYRLCEQRRFRRACSSAQSRQNLRCSLIQAVSQEEPSDRMPDPWPL